MLNGQFKHKMTRLIQAILYSIWILLYLSLIEISYLNLIDFQKKLEKQITMNLPKILAIIMFTFISICETDAQMTEAFNELNEMLEEFDNGDEMISQVFSVDDDKPYEVTMTRVIKNNKKGKEEVEVFSFNLALINPKKIERKSKKDEMSITFKTSKGKFIKRTEDGDSKFDSKMKVIAQDIDIARDIEVYFKELIEMGNELWDSAIQVPATIEEINSLISSFGSEMKNEKISINQSLKKNDTDENGLMEIVRETTKKGKSEVEKILFYWGDLEPNSVSTKNEGAFQVLTIKAKNKKKLIAYISEDKLEYSSSLQLYFSSPSDAIYTSEMIASANKLGSQITESSLSKFENCEGKCLSMMKEIVISSTSKIENTTMTEDCQATIVISDKKSKKMEWHWSDIATGSVNVDYNSSNQTISFKTKNKKKFITYYKEDGKIDKYDDEFEFDIADVYSAKSLEILVPQIVQECNRDLDVKDMTWMSNYVSSVTVDDGKYDQSIEQTDDECSYMYKLENKEKGKEETYEFNLYDLNPKSIKLDISKNKINLNVVTKGKEKLITKYEEGGDLKYEKEIDLKFDDLLSARIAQNTLQELINSCQ
ncbi:MAG: hypothetical protein ACI86M_003284 [Saprospiraceae bacterium]|jgi:hypothetical protein